jgi:hypothetical protein
MAKYMTPFEQQSARHGELWFTRRTRELTADELAEMVQIEANFERHEAGRACMRVRRKHHQIHTGVAL